VQPLASAYPKIIDFATELGQLRLLNLNHL
jgi:hypothetical protein